MGSCGFVGSFFFFPRGRSTIGKVWYHLVTYHIGLFTIYILRTTD